MSRLSLSLFGAKQLLLDGSPSSSFGYAKAFVLLAYLAVEAERAYSRQALVGLLWPDLPEAAGLTNLRQVLADLRRALGDESQSPRFLLTTRESIQLNPKSAVDLDVATFLRLLSNCDAHRHRHIDRCRACLARLEEVMRLYRGDFLSGFTVNEAAPFEEWAAQRREEYHRRAQQALAHLAAHALRLGDDEHAQRILQRQLELEPWSEEAHQQLMRLYARRGQRATALRQYERCRRVLLEELGIEPDAATQTLYARIRDGLALPDEAEPPLNQVRVALPVPSTTFVGRGAELAQLSGLLADPAQRLITILGPGGIGKTRLALTAASEQAGTFRNGTCFVPLAGVRDARFLPQAILTALNAPPRGEQALQAQLLALLRDQELLLVLDNYEQLLPNVDLLTYLLRRAPGVTLLVTSRERLALQAEHLIEVTGLEYPRASRDGAANGMSLDEYDALRLFLQRVRQVQPGFLPEPVEQAAILRIAQISEGMPLALELAAASVRSQSCAAVAASLESGKQVLSALLRDLPERQRSMQAVFEHSMRLLSPAERRTFCALALFRGGFGLEAAQEVAGATPDILAALVDKSLLRRTRSGRYDMHELVRQVAERELEASDEAAHARDRYAHYFLTFVKAAEPELQSVQQATWMERAEQEIDNLRTVLAWLAHDSPEDALRMAFDLFWFWESSRYLREGYDWLVTLTSQPALPPTALQAEAYAVTGFLAFGLNRIDEVPAWLAKSQAIYETLDRADPRIATGYARLLSYLGLVPLSQGDYARVVALNLQALEIARRVGATWQAARALFYLGEADWMQGRLDEAKANLEESLRLGRETGNLRGYARRIIHLGLIACTQDDIQGAADRGREALAICAACNDRSGVAQALLVMALVAHRNDCHPRATRLLAAVETLSETNPINHSFPSHQRAYACALTTARENLDDSIFSALWAEGRAMPMEQAVAYALADEG